MLIRPLPFADPAKLAILWSEIPRRDIHEIGVSYSSLNQWRSQSRLLADMAIFEPAYEALACLGLPSERRSGSLGNSRAPRQVEN